MHLSRLIAVCLCASVASGAGGTATPSVHDLDLTLPAPGRHQLRVLSPTILELSLITTKLPDPARPGAWDWVDANSHFRPPAAQNFKVKVEGKQAAIEAIGFKRRPLYAPLKQRDLRIANHLYLRLAKPVSEHQTLEVQNPGTNLWPAQWQFVATVDSLRYNPAIHVNQVGYLPEASKKAMVGFYLGSLGEMEVASPAGFKLVDSGTGREVYRGNLIGRRDTGFPDPAYQDVWEVDFSDFKSPGEYRLLVSGLGASVPFFIGDGVAAAFARTYALGLYHQRCGTNNALPFTRFVHGVCHVAPAEVPTPRSKIAREFLKEVSDDYSKNPRHTASQLRDLDASLYPFGRQGKIDVSGGHHDAGDYSKYTINSAGLVHHLVFAADAFPGAGELDNLGIPESGDGKSDLLQEAKWEADFLAKMQDADGGFYFLVYPRDRKYENNVLPDQGDPQVVWPKNTAATAAAVGALAQCASSPLFKRQFPGDARRYLQGALHGWKFLTNAIARHGKDGAYQKMTHYGDDFMHDDELAWSACELFVATGEQEFHDKLRAWLNPADPHTRKWGWWRMYEGFGRAIRSYAFAARTGRLRADQLDPLFLSRCEAEIVGCAEQRLRAAQQSAYGTSFPEPTKRVRTAGWYFSLDQAFDLAVACQFDYPPRNDRRDKFRDAMLSNLNYEAGCNPVNVCYVTGLGWRRQREIVHQYAQNDRRVLPPSGIPIGNLQGGFGWLDRYQQELGALCFPLDGAPDAPYPIYDRWGDSFNLTTEFVIANQARALAVTAFLMALTPLKNQPWEPLSAEIAGLPAESPVQKAVTARLKVAGLDLSTARIVWEAQDQEPAFGPAFSFVPAKPGAHWVEAEAQWPDGRRAFAMTHFTVSRR